MGQEMIQLLPKKIFVSLEFLFSKFWERLENTSNSLKSWLNSSWTSLSSNYKNTIIREMHWTCLKWIHIWILVINLSHKLTSFKIHWIKLIDFNLSQHLFQQNVTKQIFRLNRVSLKNQSKMSSTCLSDCFNLYLIKNLLLSILNILIIEQISQFSLSQIYKLLMIFNSSSTYNNLLRRYIIQLKFLHCISIQILIIWRISQNRHSKSLCSINWSQNCISKGTPFFTSLFEFMRIRQFL